MNRASSLASLFATVLQSPLGNLLLVKSDAGLRRIAFENEDFTQVLASESSVKKLDVVNDAQQFSHECEQLQAYFAGQAHSFTLALDLPATGFRRRTQRSLADIPHGSTVTYGELAAIVGNPGAARAVGSACATNPLPIVLPCHRVLAAGGALGGYSGELWRKSRLLELERSA